MMKIWGQRESDACPRCGEKEIAAQVLAFQDEDVVRVFHDSVETLDEWVIKSDMVPEVQQAIKQALIMETGQTALSP